MRRRQLAEDGSGSDEGGDGDGGFGSHGEEEVADTSGARRRAQQESSVTLDLSVDSSRTAFGLGQAAAAAAAAASETAALVSASVVSAFAQNGTVIDATLSNATRSACDTCGIPSGRCPRPSAAWALLKAGSIVVVAGGGPAGAGSNPSTTTSTSTSSLTQVIAAAAGAAAGVIVIAASAFVARQVWRRGQLRKEWEKGRTAAAAVVGGPSPPTSARTGPRHIGAPRTHVNPVRSLSASRVAGAATYTNPIFGGPSSSRPAPALPVVPKPLPTAARPGLVSSRSAFRLASLAPFQLGQQAGAGRGAAAGHVQATSSPGAASAFQVANPAFHHHHHNNNNDAANFAGELEGRGGTGPRRAAFAQVAMR
jgi:hypothetical protein